MKLYKDYKNKHTIAEYISTIALNHFHDHDIHFLTITIKDTLTPPPFEFHQDKMKTIHEKLKQSCFNRPSKTKKHLPMICVPELSHPTPDSLSDKKRPSSMPTASKPHHFHCFLMIPHTQRERFIKRAVKAQPKAFHKGLDKHVLKTILNDDLLDKKRLPDQLEFSAWAHKHLAYKKRYMTDERFEKLIRRLWLKARKKMHPLQTFDYDIIQLQTADDIRAVANYMTKKLNGNFSHQEVLYLR